jgi:queuine tRNA-ribosyltransferase
MKLITKTKTIDLPAFFPDGTHGVIKSLDSLDIKGANIKGIVVNAYHLLVDDKIRYLEKSGGINKFMKFDGPVISDSGGFQAMSLVRRNGNGKLNDKGILFKNEGNGKSIFLNPENCIETQISIGSDIVMCLDDCTDPDESLKEQEISVDRTIEWAIRCKAKFDELTKRKREKPLLFGIIQGGNEKKLRKKCAAELIKIGFDGYAFGGWPVYKGSFMDKIVKYTAELMPKKGYKYAMGVGKPIDIVKSIGYGYNMFDCVLPTRDARHKRLYVFKTKPERDKLNKDSFGYIRIGSAKYSSDKKPVSKHCDCLTCQNYSRSYLNHLFKVKENTAFRLATIHNLRFYSMLMELYQ